jgi:hypothetical protein
LAAQSAQNNQATFNLVVDQNVLATWQAQAVANQAKLSTPMSQYGINREPWVFATFDAIRNVTNQITTTGQESALPNINPSTAGYNNSANTIFWTASPKSITWQINQRGSEEKNKSGTVLHVWRDRTRRTDYDDPKINIHFQTGSIYPTFDGNQKQQISTGLNNFYQFLELVDAPKISATGEPNVIHILYRSAIFPSMVLTGFFDPQVVVQFTDDSQNPWQVTGWSANFTIYSSTPKFRSFSELRNKFMQDGLLLEPNFNQIQASQNQPRVTPAQAATGNNSAITNAINSIF